MSRLVEAVAPRRLGTPFRWLLSASFVANLGDGFTAAAGPLLVASQTHSPALVAAAAFLQRLPWLLFALYAGVVADRRNRKAIVIGSDVVHVVVLLVLIGCIAGHAVNIAVVLVVLFVLGIVETFRDTTSGTLMPMLVPKADLGIANARQYAAVIPANQMFGPPIGAALFAAGMALPFVGEAVLILTAITLMSRVRVPVVAPAGTGRLRADMVEGVRWLWQHAAVRTLALTIFTFNITYGAAWSVLVLYSRERLHMGEIGFGLITTSIAVGGTLSTASYGWLEKRVALGTIMRAVLLTETAVLLVLAITQTAWLALIAFLFFGAESFIWGTTSTSVRQRAVPSEFQGRVNSVYLSGTFGGLVVGAAIGGGIAQVWGITAPFWFAFVGSALILTLIWRALTQIAHAEAPEPA